VEEAGRPSTPPRSESEPPSGSLDTSQAMAQVLRARRHALSAISSTICGLESPTSGTALGATAVAITVSRLLELGHGAATTRSSGSNGRGSGIGAGSSWSHQGGGGAGTAEAAAASAAATAAAAAPVEVVLGVLVFESLREGDVAVSSLFLQDETGMYVRS